MARMWLIGGAVALVALLIVSVAFALRERETPFQPGTPQAAVQDYLKALEASEYEIAYNFLSTDLKKDCTLEDFAGVFPPRPNELRDNRITLEDTRTVGNNTIVTVRITQFYGSGPFGTSESSWQNSFSLRQEDGQWRFTEYPWPHNYRCPNKPVTP